MTEKKNYRKEAEVLGALAHKTRLAIIYELAAEEKCVTNIKDLINVQQSNISQHLSVLRWAGIVDCRSEGKSRCYYLKDPKTLRRLLVAVEELIEEDRK